MDSAPTELLVMITIGIGLMLVLALSFVLFFSFSQNKLRKEQFKAQQAKIEYQEKLLHSTILTQEKERQRIAKDLHDEVGSKLNVVHLHLHRLTKKAPEAQTNIDNMLDVINDTIQTTRRISHDLLPPTLENFGLETAIEELCDRIQQSGEQEVFFNAEGERPEGIDPLIELNVFRILHELINNTVKYAEAAQIHIGLWLSPTRLSLSYKDNGKGFDMEDVQNQKGLGMKNIESRLQMIQGQYQLQSAPGQGVQVQIEVKIPTAQLAQAVDL